MPESLNNSPPMSPADRLLRFEAACEAIYPAIRFFGLCGCDAKYLAAIIEIGDLLGKHNSAGPQVDRAAIVRAAQEDAVEQISAWIASAPEVRAKVGRGLQSDFAELVAKLRISHDDPHTDCGGTCENSAPIG